MPSDLLERLSPNQREAVLHEGGPLIVVAGPGAGKTRVMTRRIGHLIAERGVEPRTVLALSFTIKAAEELRTRLIDLIGPSAADAVQATTFNSFGAGLTRRFADVAGLPPHRSMLDSAQRKRLMRAAIREKGFLARTAAGGIDSAIELASARISAMHNAGKTATEAIVELEKAVRAEHAAPDLEDWLDAANLWSDVTVRARVEGLLSYEDQIALPTELMERDTRVADMVRADCAHVVVDEFQDLNTAQLRLLRSIAPPGTGADIAVVGDDDQAIYGFRGADDRALERFKKVWTKDGDTVRPIELGENWRSERVVVDVSAKIIAEAHERFNDGKALVCARAEDPPAEGASVEAVVFAREDWRNDAPAIAAMILHRRQAEPDLPWNRIAVIARTHPDLSRVQGALELAGVPVERARDRDSGDDPAVQDVLAWARLLVDPAASWCVRRILRRPPLTIPEGRVGAWEQAYQARRSRLEAGDEGEPALPGAGNFLEFLGEHIEPNDAARPAVDRLLEWFGELSAVAAERPADEAIEQIVRTTGAASIDLPDARRRARRIRSLVALLRFARERRGRIEQPGDLRAFISYYDDLDAGDRTLEARGEDAEDSPGGTADAVQLLTAHAAKGLEFDTVYMPRVGQYGYPSSARAADEGELPACLATADDIEPRDPLHAHADEERRLFYVALTRAERRAVAVGVLPKKLGGSTYFLNELIEAGAVARTGAEVIEAAREAGAYAGEPAHAEMQRADAEAFAVAAADAKRRAREMAAAALDAVDRRGAGEEDVIAAAARLAEAARALAGVGVVERGGDVPAWAPGDAGSGARRLADVRAGIAPDVRTLEPMRAPISLSYSMIDGYIRCPRCFYIRHVMGLSEGFAVAMGVGNAVHRAMQEYTKLCRDADADSEPWPGLEALLSEGRKAVLRAWPRGEVIEQADRERVEAQLRIAFEHLVSDDDETLEVEKEVRFGYVSEAVGEHRFRAVIDRVDRAEGGVRLIDYKTGHASKEKLEPKKDDLQLGVYAMAARALFADGELAGTAEYWMLSTGQRGVTGLDRLREGEAKLRKVIDGAVAGMLEGRYPKGKRCRGECESVFPEG